MKTVLLSILLVAGFMLTNTISSYSQELTTDKQSKLTTKQKSDMNNSTTLNTYVIERDIPEAGKLNGEQLKGISQTSCGVIKELGPEIVWLHSYVTENKIYCIYQAKDKKILEEHAKKGGFPINSVSQLSTIISPETAN
jgi:hypothetical protein